uniref:LRAT domain-containing protein n=1 Tax=Sparus aurata TaxID=8175 RepID=A0A671VGP0_SPAAU
MLHVLLLSPCQLSTAATMKSLILVAVILQLVIIGIKTDGKVSISGFFCSQYQFGDIIEFPRACMEGMPTFSHYAVYVGPEICIKFVDNISKTLFSQTDWKGREDVCEFGKLDETRRKSIDEKKNYLEDEIPAGERTPDKIKKRIREMQNKEKCGNYTYLSNSCEHLVTYVRYGIRRSLKEHASDVFFLWQKTPKWKKLRNMKKSSKV